MINAILAFRICAFFRFGDHIVLNYHCDGAQQRINQLRNVSLTPISPA
jgi:hypothetical protein